MRHAMLASLALTSAVPAAAETVSGQPVFVDGDSFEIAGRKVRLFGIDAPEATQTCDRAGEEWPCGQEAARQLQSAVGSSALTCSGNEHDQYGRLLAVCSIDGIELNRYLVARGWAVAFRRYSEDYVADETRARAAKLGIWSSSFVPPEDYRRPGQLAPSTLSGSGQTVRKPPARDRTPSSASIYFHNCNEARAAGAAPIYRGQPGYRPEMDGDSDGIACEPYRGRG